MYQMGIFTLRDDMKRKKWITGSLNEKISI